MNYFTNITLYYHITAQVFRELYLELDRGWCLNSYGHCTSYQYKTKFYTSRFVIFEGFNIR